MPRYQSLLRLGKRCQDMKANHFFEVRKVSLARAVMEKYLATWDADIQSSLPLLRSGSKRRPVT